MIMTVFQIDYDSVYMYIYFKYDFYYTIVYLKPSYTIL